MLRVPSSLRGALSYHPPYRDRLAQIQRSLVQAAADDHAHCGDDSATSPDDINCLLHATASGDHIFGDDEFLAGSDLKTAPESETARPFFDKDVTFAQSAADFLGQR